MKTESQEVFEAGLIALVDTARKAFVEGFNEGTTEFPPDADYVQVCWERSETYAACIKAVETYTGKPFKA